MRSAALAIAFCVGPGIDIFYVNPSVRGPLGLMAAVYSSAPPGVHDRSLLDSYPAQLGYREAVVDQGRVRVDSGSHVEDHRQIKGFWISA
jgi:hypothetical protein